MDLLLKKWMEATVLMVVFTGCFSFLVWVVVSLD